MKIQNIAQSINAAKGIGMIRLGFWLNKKPDPTPQEKAAAKAFIRIFRGTLGLVLLFAVILFVLTGYAVSGTELQYDGPYDESRTGRVENGQIRYVKNELYCLDPETIGLPEDLPDGTHINLYFDESGAVVAGENADEMDAVVKSRVILVLAAAGAMAAALVVFALAARKTFGKAWYLWLQSLQKGGA